MRNKEYFESPNHCPVCHGQKLEFKLPKYHKKENIVSQYSECLTCGETWLDIYREFDEENNSICCHCKINIRDIVFSKNLNKGKLGSIIKKRDADHFARYNIETKHQCGGGVATIWKEWRIDEIIQVADKKYPLYNYTVWS